MKILAPWSPLSLDFFKEDNVTSLTMIVDNDMWNIIRDNNLDKPLLKKSVPWQDAFKGTVKIVAELEEDGWDLDEEGFTVPLFVQEGSSDKEYHVNLTKTPSGWNTICLYGRRGSSLATANKATSASLSDAWKEFRDVVAKKSKEGYQFYIAGVDYQSGAHFEKVGGLSIALLSEAENLEALIADDSYYMQEKFDGERRPIVKTETAIVGTNKEGISVNLNKKFEKVLESVAGTFKIDCEDLGDKLAVFDITEHNGQSLIQTPFKDRLDILYTLFKGNTSDCLIIAKTCKTQTEKKALVAELIARKAEGVVFKKADSGYSHGKNLEGTQLKFKFYAEATVVVVQQNLKRSVQVGVVDANACVIPVGNVTIATNAEIPQVGQIVEVKYLYAYLGGCLFLPTYKGVRPDQTLQSCEMAKLKYKADYDYAQEVCSHYQ